MAVSKRISKIVQSEGKAERNSLEAAIGELKGIQKMQRAAVKVLLFFFVGPTVGLKNKRSPRDVARNLNSRLAH